MTTTRIAGTAYDARHQSQVHELARIHTYATRIRHIARKAATTRVSLPEADRAEIVPVHVRPEPSVRVRPDVHQASSLKIAS